MPTKKALTDSAVIKSEAEYESMPRVIEATGVIKAIVNSNSVYVTYKSANAKMCLLQVGAILELHTYYESLDSGRYTDCRVGVHLDWYGKIAYSETEVRNEEDVLLLERYAPVFISCKNGKVDQYALYELNTVAERFGGKYAKKRYIVSHELSKAC